MNSDTQLIVSKLFEGKEIRAIYINGEPWIPIVDISEAWGIDRSNPTKIIKRNREVFTGLSTVVDVTSPATSPSDIIGNSLKCVNEKGVYVLALKVSAGRIKNKEVKERIIRFQKWVPELIQQFRKGEIIQNNQIKKPVDILNEQLDIAESIIKRTEIPKGQAYAYAIILAGDKAGIDLQCYATYFSAQTKQNLLPEPVIEVLPEDIADYERHFSLKKVAESQGIQKPENEIRNLMERLGIIYRENNMWHLTREGEKYGKVFFITPGAPYSTARKPWIKYNPTLIKLLRDYYNVKVPVTRIVG